MSIDFISGLIHVILEVLQTESSLVKADVEWGNVAINIKNNKKVREM